MIIFEINGHIWVLVWIERWTCTYFNSIPGGSTAAVTSWTRHGTHGTHANYGPVLDNLYSSLPNKSRHYAYLFWTIFPCLHSYLGAYVYLIFKVWFSYLKIYYQLYTSAPYVNRAIHYLLGNLACLQLFFQKKSHPYDYSGAYNY